MRVGTIAACGFAALAAVACGDTPSWGSEELRTIWLASLAALHAEIGVDTLVVEPRPRYLVMEDDVLTMGDFSAFPEPIFSSALQLSPGVVACDAPRQEMGCAHEAAPRRASMSDVLPMGKREAVVLASWIDASRAPVVGRMLRIQLRYAGGSWRVVRVERHTPPVPGVNP